MSLLLLTFNGVRPFDLIRLRTERVETFISANAVTQCERVNGIDLLCVYIWGDGVAQLVERQTQDFMTVTRVRILPGA